MFVIKFKKLFIGISIALVVIAIAAVAVFGLPLGIDFKGGSALDFSYTATRPDVIVLQQKLAAAGFPDATVQPTGDTGVLVKNPEITEAQRADMVSVLTSNGTVAGTEQGFTAIGPSVGTQLKHKAIVATILVLIAIILFVAYAFRKVSKPVSSWKFGVAVILALVHDIIIPLGAFAILAHYRGVELDTLFIVALLTTLALSVSDTIVVFDRIREHLHTNNKQPFDQLVGESLSQTFVRSINTSLMVLVMVVALAVFGPKSTQLFAIVLAIGMFFGTYSSIFLASPLLVVMEQSQKKVSKK